MGQLELVLNREGREGREREEGEGGRRGREEREGGEGGERGEREERPVNETLLPCIPNQFHTPDLTLAGHVSL